MPFIRCNDINIYYNKDGNGPSLLLINGLGADTRILTFLIDLLSTSFTVVSFDMRGAGKSDKPKAPYTIEQISNDALHLIEQLCDQSVHVLGYSMGGCVAMDLALRHSDIVKSLILVSTLPSWHRPHPVSDRTDALLHRTDISPQLLSEVHDTIFGNEYKKRHPVEEYIELRLEDPNPQPAYAYLNQLAALENFDLFDEVADISVRTLIVAGECDEVVPPKNSFWLKQTIANSDSHILEDVGHMVPLEAPKSLAKLVIEAG